ncbi:MAG: alpha/beta hydrolase [Nevskia sp.]|nr:alpha/beta hydrolase [Nevskia sp.]
MTGTEELQPRYIRANGMEFAYLCAGEGPLVLCLHGFPDTAWSFADLLRRLAAAGFRGVAPFMRGYAPTDIPPDRDYSCLALGRDVIALLEHLEVPDAAIVGHDWGAGAAYAAASLRPDRIRRVVTAAVPHLRRFLLRPTRAQLRRSSYMFKFQLPAWPEKRIRENDFAWLLDLARSWSPGWELPAAYVAQVKAAFSDPARLKAALGYYRAMPGLLFNREAWHYLLAPLQVPARVIYGEKDGCIAAEMFADMEHLFAGDYELVGIPGAGHFMHLEAPDAFAEQVLGFLQKGQPGAAGRRA